MYPASTAARDAPTAAPSASASCSTSDELLRRAEPATARDDLRRAAQLGPTDACRRPRRPSRWMPRLAATRVTASVSTTGAAEASARASIDALTHRDDRSAPGDRGVDVVRAAVDGVVRDDALVIARDTDASTPGPSGCVRRTGPRHRGPRSSSRSGPRRAAPGPRPRPARRLPGTVRPRLRGLGDQHGSAAPSAAAASAQPPCRPAVTTSATGVPTCAAAPRRPAALSASCPDGVHVQRGRGSNRRVIGHEFRSSHQSVLRRGTRRAARPRRPRRRSSRPPRAAASPRSRSRSTAMPADHPASTPRSASVSVSNGFFFAAMMPLKFGNRASGSAR